MLAFVLMSCTEHGERPTTCEADFVLVGSPGAFESSTLELRGTERVELCLALDSTRNDSDVTLRVDTGTVESSLAISLRSVDGIELAASHGALIWELPARTSLDTILSFELEPSLIGLTTQLSLGFAEMP